MKKADGWKIAGVSISLFVLLVLAIILIRFTVESMGGGPDLTGKSRNHGSLTSGGRTITVTAGGSEEVKIPPTHRLQMRWLGGQENPLILHYNGGKGKGGWDLPVPAYKDWKPGYEPPTYEDVLTSISFSLQNRSGGAASVQCSLVRK